ncbi:hypothetical protein HDU85_005916 [Gaertneriomyces sp. JEL0708]|nr:hypothetical protein HDU85_005916 [Gaertneriomyces sp. JEL0708]
MTRTAPPDSLSPPAYSPEPPVVSRLTSEVHNRNAASALPAEGKISYYGIGVEKPNKYTVYKKWPLENYVFSIKTLGMCLIFDLLIIESIFAIPSDTNLGWMIKALKWVKIITSNYLSMVSLRACTASFNMMKDRSGNLVYDASFEKRGVIYNVAYIVVALFNFSILYDLFNIHGDDSSN